MTALLRLSSEPFFDTLGNELDFLGSVSYFYAFQNNRCRSDFYRSKSLLSYLPELQIKMHIDTNRNFIDDTLFVVVIYNRRIDQSVAFQSLCKSDAIQNAKDIFIYDNSLQLQTVGSKAEKIHYFHNPHNVGVSAAYNKAFEIAKDLNKKWLLLADQDTHFEDRAFEVYGKSIAQFPNESVFVPQVISSNKLISPFKLIAGKGIRVKPRQPGIHFLRQWCVINSGLLISLNSFKAAGGYDERFPLDFSDIIFTERLTKMTERFVLINSTCVHSLSSYEDRISASDVVFNRFEKFCKAARLFKKTSNKKVVLILILLPRAIKLTLMKREMRFLFLALSTMVTN